MESAIRRRASAFCGRVVRRERESGGMSSREMSAPLLPLTVAGGVDVMVAGFESGFGFEDLNEEDGERERGGSGGSGGC